MFRSTGTRSALFLAALTLLSACGASGDDDGDSRSEAEDAAPSTTGTASGPDGDDVDAVPDGTPDTAPSPDAGPVGSGDHPLEGSWIGELYEDGTQPNIEIYANGYLSVESDGITCNGEVDALQCLVRTEGTPGAAQPDHRCGTVHCISPSSRATSSISS
jgi:hypothetical protein